MEKIEIIRENFQDTLKCYQTANGSNASYYEGKLVGLAQAAALFLNITWIEADVLLRKE